MTQPYARIGVVIAEVGAIASAHIESVRSSGAELLIVKQRPGELPELFARRCRERVAEVAQAGAHIVEARLVGASGGRSARILSRVALIRLLVAPMARQGQGRLILCGPQSERTSFMGMAEVVRTQIRGTGVIVTTEVDSAEAEPGAYDAAGEARA